MELETFFPSPHIFLKEPPRGEYKVGVKPVVVYCMIHYHGSDSGFSKDGWEIASIFDRDGNRLEPVFSRKAWSEIAPGVATGDPGYNAGSSSFQDICNAAIAISREACPLRVIFKSIGEYNDYDDWEACTASSEVIKTVFVAAENE
ncbi:MAG: hypothetical protein Fur0043_23510 [Anaerolineales bacterium]